MQASLIVGGAYSEPSSTFHLHKEREFISPDQYKIHHCVLLEVFISDYKYFGRGLQTAAAFAGCNYAKYSITKLLAL
jgi:hypothetical protein